VCGCVLGVVVVVYGGVCPRGARQEGREERSRRFRFCVVRVFRSAFVLFLALLPFVCVSSLPKDFCFPKAFGPFFVLSVRSVDRHHIHTIHNIHTFYITYICFTSHGLYLSGFLQVCMDRIFSPTSLLPAGRLPFHGCIPTYLSKLGLHTMHTYSERGGGGGGERGRQTDNHPIDVCERSGWLDR